MMDEKDIRNEERMEEVPTIVIERIEDDERPSEIVKEVQIVAGSNIRRRILVVAAIVIALLLGVIAWLILKPRPIPTAPVLPVSMTADEHIELLVQPFSKQESKEKPRVTVKEDSINNVPLREYALQGLRAELSFDEPSPDDKSVYFYTHSADYRSDNGQVLDACVIQGKQVSVGDNRSGFLAAVGNRTLIGVALNDSVLDYVRDNGGYYFRQFALVSDGQKGDIRLKGKVERRAIARRGNHLFCVETLNRESLYDFAEALCDYGYTDAIYITGGNSFGYYRDKKGSVHVIGVSTDSIHEPMKSAKAPFLIFKKLSR